MIAAIRACRENEEDPPGCVLENFPRSIGQLRQLEKAYLADFIPDPATQASFLASADAFFDTLQKERSSTPSPTDSYILQSIDAVVELIGDVPTFMSQSAMQNALSYDISHGEALGNKGIDEDVHTHNANPILLSTKLFGSHNRFLQIDNSGLHDAVVLEAIHIAIECFTNGNFQRTAILEFLSHTYYPPMFMPAQRKHRDKASISDQFYWLNAEKQLKIDKRDIMRFCAEIKEINKKSNAKIVMLLSSVFTVVRMVVGQCHELEQDLRRILDVRQSLQQKLDKAFTMAGIPEKDRSPVNKQNILEVELGDIVDDSRMKANSWVEKHVSPVNINEHNLGDLKQEVISLAHPLCEALIDGTLKRINSIEDNIYAKLPFLRFEEVTIVSPLLLENIPVLSSIQEIITLSNGKQESNMLQLLHRMNESIAALFCQNESADRTSKKIRQTADFVEEKESNRSKMIIEDIDAWTSAPYAQRTGPQFSDYAQKCNDDSDMLIIRTSVYQNAFNGLLYQIYAACDMITSLYYIVDELYLGECSGFNEVITNITKQHFHDISGMMMKFKHVHEVPGDDTVPWRCFIWPITRPEETRSFSLLASHLPSLCQSNFLSLLQVKVLIQEFQLLRVDDVEASNFIKVVHDCSKKNDFPDKWLDSLFVVSLSQSYVSRDGLIYWKSVILSILRIQFTDVTTIQEAEECCKNLISRFCSQSNQPTLMEFMRSTLSFNDFVKLPKWFSTSTSIHNDFAMGDEVASVTFDLISTRRPSISQEPFCTIQSVFWLINATISSPPLRHCQLFAHENMYHVQKLNRLLPTYSMGAIRGAAIVNQLVDAGSFIHDGNATQLSPYDEQITRESAADALCALLEVSNFTLHDSTLETINECAMKLRRFYHQNPDMSYALLAGEDIVQTSRIAIRLSLYNPFSSLASNTRN
uniref:AlNc14C89G5638 protein n=1 Tax=Albugo laibachii Nc14 TaxID=890382 RepID=F0WGA8_9STRA|nr:AlNc14C89G5638 [Albugo laibachii Nc14]|eukprot:CCA20243.1 AlNc14C89G5638 [Albugo laibachii Nc14]